MVRSIKRKAIEELYGGKFDKHTPAKFPVNNNNSLSTTKTISHRMERVGGATDRAARKATHGDVRASCAYTTANNYVITSNCPVTATNMRSTPNAAANAMPSTQHQYQALHAHPHPHPHQHQLQQQQQHMPQLSNAYASSARRKANGTVRMGHTKSSYAREDAKLLAGSDGKSVKLKEGVQGKPITHRGLPLNNDMAGCYNSGDSHCSDREERGDGLAATHTHNHRHHGHRHHGQLQHNQHRHEHRTHHVSKEDDDADEDAKDNEPEEFFKLIGRTVQNAIGTTVSDVLQHYFREVNTKLDRFSAELKQTNDNLNALQEHIMGKVTHYGEENSRHFRYLCMKAEYDKMFYQHQAMVGSKKQTARTSSVTTSKSTQMSHAPSKTNAQLMERSSSGNQCQAAKELPPKQRSGEMSRRRVSTLPTIVATNTDASDCAKVSNPCVCRSTNKQLPPLCEPQKSSSDDSVGNKSSEVGMRAVLEHIQRFCTQMQLNDFNPDQQLKEKFLNKDMLLNITNVANARTVAPMPKHLSTATAAAATAPTASASVVDVYNDGEDFEYQVSSDNESLHSDDSEVAKYMGNLTRRGPRVASIQAGGGGGGDGD